MNREPRRLRREHETHTRYLGRFLAKGISEPFRFFEVLGAAPALNATPAWVATFAQGVSALEHHDWDAAETQFEEVIRARGGADGPSRFLLEWVRHLRREADAGQSWDGVFRMRG